MPSPLEIHVVDGDLEKAFKNLKKKMALEGIFKELKRRRYYEKPSEEKKRKREEAERRRLKKLRRLAAQTRQRRYSGGAKSGRGGRPQGRMDDND
jgi:small subunit ribosomal protein S21